MIRLTESKARCGMKLLICGICGRRLADADEEGRYYCPDSAEHWYCEVLPLVTPQEVR